MISEYVGNNKKYRLRPWVKYVAAVAGAAVLAVVAVLMPEKPQIVGADVGTAQVRNVNIGTLGINNPATYNGQQDLA